MMLPMTDPIDEEPRERRTEKVQLGGETFTVTEFTETQLLHMGRYARILTRDDVSRDDKFDAMDRMFTLIHKCVPASELPRLTELEEDGVVTLRDLVAFPNAFKRSEDTAPKVVRRRGRPRKSV